MSLMPWKHKRDENEDSSLAPLDLFHSEIDRLFDSFFRDPFGSVPSGFAGGDWSPTLDVGENESEVIVRAELPGVKAEDLDVSVIGDTLVLSGEKKETREQKERNYWHSENRYGAFRRQVRLPAEVTPENVDAHFANGVLLLKLPKATSARPRKIELKTGSGQKVSGHSTNAKEVVAKRRAD